MPKRVDAQERADQILTAAIRLLSEGGFVRLTLTNLADQLGGSITLVTHYYRNRQELIAGILARSQAQTTGFLERLHDIDDVDERLRYTLEWFLPLDDEGLQLERARVALAVHRDLEPVIAAFFDRVEPDMRGALRTAIGPFVPSDDLEPVVDVLRVWTSGMTLATVEHPEIWTPDRQRAALSEFLRHVKLVV